MSSINNTISGKHNRSRIRIHKPRVQSQTLEVIGMGNTGEHEMRNTCVDKIEMCELLDSYRFKCQVL